MATLTPLLALLTMFLLPQQPTTTPVKAKVLYQHLPKQCQAAFVADLSTLLPHTLKLATQLGGSQMVQNSPFSRRVNMGLNMFQMQRKLWTKRLGMDPVKAITYFGACANLEGRPRRGVAFVGGNFSAPTLVAKLIQSMGMPPSTRQKKGHFEYIETGRGPIVAWYTKGKSPLFIGRKRDVLFFLSTGKPGQNPNAIRSLMTRQHRNNTLASFAVVLTPKIHRKLKFSGAPIVKKLTGSLKYMHASMGYRGAALTLGNPKASSQALYASLFRGLGMLAISADYAVRGILQIAGALIDPKDPSLPGPVRMAAKYKGKIFGFLRKSMGKKITAFGVQRSGQQVQLTVRGKPNYGLFGALATFGLLAAGVSRNVSSAPKAAPTLRYKRPLRSQSARGSASSSKSTSSKSTRPKAPPRAAPKKDSSPNKDAAPKRR